MTDRALYALLARRYGDGTDLRRTDTAADHPGEDGWWKW